MKTEEKQKAIEMRQNGMSLGQIAKKLMVSKGSVSLWTKGIVLTDEQQEKLVSRVRYNDPNLEKSKICRDRRMQYQHMGAEKAVKCDNDFAFGCALFWGEGAKSQTQVSICNTDVQMLVFFVNFLKKYFDAKPYDFSICVNCYLNNNLSLEQIQSYWVNQFGLTKENITKATIKNKYYGDIKNNKYPYGVCRVTISDVKIVQQIYGAIKQIIGDVSDRWIDIQR